MARGRDPACGRDKEGEGRAEREDDEEDADGKPSSLRTETRLGRSGERMFARDTGSKLMRVISRIEDRTMPVGEDGRGKENGNAGTGTAETEKGKRLFEKAADLTPSSGGDALLDEFGAGHLPACQKIRLRDLQQKLLHRLVAEDTRILPVMGDEGVPVRHMHPP